MARRPLVREVVLRALLVNFVLALLLSTTVTTTEFIDVRAADGAAGEGSRDPRWTQYPRPRYACVQ